MTFPDGLPERWHALWRASKAAPTDDIELEVLTDLAAACAALRDAEMMFRHIEAHSKPDKARVDYVAAVASSSGLRARAALDALEGR